MALDAEGRPIATEAVVAKEVGLNRYERLKGFDCSAGVRYRAHRTVLGGSPGPSTSTPQLLHAPEGHPSGRADTLRESSPGRARGWHGGTASRRSPRARRDAAPLGHLGQLVAVGCSERRRPGALRSITRRGSAGERYFVYAPDYARNLLGGSMKRLTPRSHMQCAAHSLLARHTRQRRLPAIGEWRNYSR